MNETPGMCSCINRKEKVWITLLATLAYDSKPLIEAKKVLQHLPKNFPSKGFTVCSNFENSKSCRGLQLKKAMA
jgi:hypothetical protein